MTYTPNGVTWLRRFNQSLYSSLEEAIVICDNIEIINQYNILICHIDNIPTVHLRNSSVEHVPSRFNMWRVLTVTSIVYLVKQPVLSHGPPCDVLDPGVQPIAPPDYRRTNPASIVEREYSVYQVLLEMNTTPNDGNATASRPVHFPGRIHVRDRIAVGVRVRLLGIAERWVQRDKLPCRRFIVAVNEIDQAGWVGITGRVPERSGGRQTADCPGWVRSGSGRRAQRNRRSPWC